MPVPLRILFNNGEAAVITATNTFPHIPDLQDFIEGIKTALAPGGVFVIEAHYLVDLLEQVAFDTIYHEHVSYWALRPMRFLFASMACRSCMPNACHCITGSCGSSCNGKTKVGPSVAELLALERAPGYRPIRHLPGILSADTKDQNRSARHPGGLRRMEEIVGYGAPAKGNTLLNFLEIGPEMLPYIADRSVLKQGLYTPGLHIPVVSPERLLPINPTMS